MSLSFTLHCDFRGCLDSAPPQLVGREDFMRHPEGWLSLTKPRDRDPLAEAPALHYCPTHAAMVLPRTTERVTA